MGFNILDKAGLTPDEEHQHINLSFNAINIIRDDMNGFADSITISFSGFLNTVISNFMEEAEASINNQLKKYKERLNEAEEYKIVEKDEKEKQINIQVNRLKDDLKKRFEKRMIKGEAKKFRINKENVNNLINCSESEDDPIDVVKTKGRYIKAILEEYAELPRYRRELIYFKKTSDAIEQAISLEKAIKITINGRKQFDVRPYKIVHDKFMLRNYLLHVSNEEDEKGEIIKTYHCSRISRISSIKIKSLSGFISATDKKMIEDEAIKKGVENVGRDIEEVCVKFTDLGLYIFKLVLLSRPSQYTVDPNDNHIYKFKCTLFQAENYFKVFGGEVNIISPNELKEKIILFHKTALESYPILPDSQKSV